MISERVQAVLPALSREWWNQAGAVQLAGVSGFGMSARSENAEPWRARASRFLVRDADLWLALHGHEQAWRKLAASWLGCEVLVDSPLTVSLQREFCLAFFRKLAGRAAPDAALAEDELPRAPASAFRAGAGTVAVELDIEGVPLMFLAPIELWPDVQIPAVTAARSKLTPAAQALAASQIRLDVQLAAVKMPLTELAALSLGDFLDLADDLSGRVCVSGLEVSLSATLGQNNGCKAICLESNESARQ
jgi:flagellar motor switch/type III secretory pathway protein FliN